MPRGNKAEQTAAPLVPQNATLDKLREAAAGCRACDLWKKGTQTVFGEGAAHASVLFVGEQPGDKEDLAGHPVVGPAGRVLDKALDEVGIDRKQVFVTNAVKHFKWEPRGKRRIHKKPNSMEIAACRPWLDAELEAVRPEVVVCLGATAAQAVLGRDFRVTKERGNVITLQGPTWLASGHPSAVLRAQTDEDRHREMAQFTADLKNVASFLRRQKAA